MATEASGAPDDRQSKTVEKRSRIRVPDGVVDHPPVSARALADHHRALAAVFDRWGYAEVKTPMFELLETLEAGLGVDAKRAAFRLVDPATGEVGVLRPDFTAQIARMVSARMSSVPRPLRISYAGRIARAADPLGRGLTAREVFQAGIELIGIADRDGDVEVLSAGADCFRSLDRKVTIDLGHSAIAEHLMKDEDPLEVGRALAAKDPSRLAAVAPALRPLLDLYGDRSVLARARAELPPQTHAALDDLEEAADRLTASYPEVTLTFDLGERRSLGYYTGLFFAGYVEGAPDAVLSGGRYDRLLGRFGREEAAVGLAIDVGALVGPSPAPGPRRGVVAVPALAAEVHRRRRAGERAVCVASAQARAYAEAHGYALLLREDPDTKQIIQERIE